MSRVDRNPWLAKMYNGSQSDFFPCLTGVRQGENLYHFLISIFLNDLEDYFCQLGGYH
jgi:hypothetical protein